MGDQKAGESSGSHQFLGKDLKLNEVKNELREMEKRRGPRTEHCNAEGLRNRGTCSGSLR